MGIFSWSKTAGSNSSVGSINWAEGMQAGAVNDSARQMMADTAAWRDDIGGALTSGGSANAQTLTTNSSIPALADRQMFGFVAGYTNTDDTTLNVDGTGAKSALKIDLAGNETELAPGDLAAGGHYLVQYDASADSATGAWIVINPSSIAVNYASDGSASAAAYSFDGDPNTGMYRSGADQVTLIGGGTGGLTVGSTAITMGTVVRLEAGSASSNSLQRSGDANTGINFPGTDQIAIAAGGTDQVTVTTTAVVLANDFRVGNASNISPGSGSAVGVTIEETTGELVVSHTIGNAPSIRTTDISLGQSYLVFYRGTTAEGGLRDDGVGTVEVFNTSDRRLKSDIEDMPDTGHVFDELRAVTYMREGARGYGFIAQEVLEAWPPAAKAGSEAGPGEEGFEAATMQKGALIPLMWDEIRRLRARVAELEAR